MAKLYRGAIRREQCFMTQTLQDQNWCLVQVIERKGFSPPFVFLFFFILFFLLSNLRCVLLGISMYYVYL